MSTSESKTRKWLGRLPSLKPRESNGSSSRWHRRSLPLVAAPSQSADMSHPNTTPSHAAGMQEHLNSNGTPTQALGSPAPLALITIEPVPPTHTIASAEAVASPETAALANFQELVMAHGYNEFRTNRPLPESASDALAWAVSQASDRFRPCLVDALLKLVAEVDEVSDALFKSMSWLRMREAEAIFIACHVTTGSTERKRQLAGLRDSKGRTLLAVSAEYGCSEFRELLLDFGADVDARDAEGKTPLYHAVSYTNRSAIRTLLARGADPLAVAPGSTALSVAEYTGTSSTDASLYDDIVAATTAARLKAEQEELVGKRVERLRSSLGIPICSNLSVASGPPTSFPSTTTGPSKPRSPSITTGPSKLRSPSITTRLVTTIGPSKPMEPPTTTDPSSTASTMKAPRGSSLSAAVPPTAINPRPAPQQSLSYENGLPTSMEIESLIVPYNASVGDGRRVPQSMYPALGWAAGLGNQALAEAPLNHGATLLPTDADVADRQGIVKTSSGVRISSQPASGAEMDKVEREEWDEPMPGIRYKAEASTKETERSSRRLW